MEFVVLELWKSWYVSPGNRGSPGNSSSNDSGDSPSNSDIHAPEILAALAIATVISPAIVATVVISVL